MIPKVIHYCWLSGDDYPELAKRCIDSWKKTLPDYEIILWDMKRDGIGEIPWVKEAFEAKKYAFAADYVRFYALYNYGGIYLDSDVEVLKSFDSLMNGEYFIGQEYCGDTEAAVIGCEANMEWVKYCLNHYKDLHFKKVDGSLDMKPVPLLINEAVEKFGLTVRPYTYFSPKNFYAGKIDIDETTFTIHHFDANWENDSFQLRLKKKFHTLLFSLFGRSGHNRIVNFIRKIFLVF